MYVHANTNTLRVPHMQWGQKRRWHRVGGWVGEARRIGKTLKCWHAKKKKQNKKYIAINITKAHGVADTCI